MLPLEQQAGASRIGHVPPRVQSAPVLLPSEDTGIESIFSNLTYKDFLREAAITEEPVELSPPTVTPPPRITTPPIGTSKFRADGAVHSSAAMGSVGGMLYASLPPRPHTTYPQTMPVRPWSGAGQVGGPTVVAPVTGAAAAGGSRCCCAGSDGVPSASSMMVATPDGNAAASAEVTRQLQSKLQEAQQLYEQQQRLMQLHATGGPVAARSVTNVPMALLDELAQMSLDAQDHVSRQETPTPLYDDMPIRRGTPPLPAARYVGPASPPTAVATLQPAGEEATLCRRVTHSRLPRRAEQDLPAMLSVPTSMFARPRPGPGR